MTDYKDFTQRYHKIKQTLQEIAENELRMAEQVEQTAVNLLGHMTESADAARTHRSHQMNPAEWLAWDAHTTLLQRRCEHQQIEVAAALVAVSEERITVSEAYREQKRFETLVEQQIKQRHVQAAQATQKEADEYAAIRFTRSRE